MLFAPCPFLGWPLAAASEGREGEHRFALDAGEEEGEFADAERAGDGAFVHEQEAHARHARGTAVVTERRGESDIGSNKTVVEAAALVRAQ